MGPSEATKYFVHKKAEAEFFQQNVPRALIMFTSSVPMCPQIPEINRLVLLSLRGFKFESLRRLLPCSLTS